MRLLPGKSSFTIVPICRRKPLPCIPKTLVASPLGPHDLRHTFAKSLLDPAAYGLDRPPMPLPAIQQLLGHADIATTTIYTRVSADDLARMMGTSESL